MVKVENANHPPDASAASGAAPFRAARSGFQDRWRGIVSGLFPAARALPGLLADKRCPSQPIFTLQFPPFLGIHPHLTRILSRLFAANMTYSDLFAVNFSRAWAAFDLLALRAKGAIGSGGAAVRPHCRELKCARRRVRKKLELFGWAEGL